MDIKAYLRLLRRHWAVILLITLIGTAAGVTVGRLQDPMYEAKTQLVVTATSSGTDSSDAYQGALLARSSAQSYASVLDGARVAQLLVDDLRLPYSADKVQSEVSATNPKDTPVIDVTVKDRSPERAKMIADRIGPLFAGVVSALETAPQNASPDVSAVRQGAVQVSVLEPAQVLPGPVSPNKVLDVVLGFVAGLALGIGVAVLREVTDTRIRGAADLRGLTEVPLLAAVPTDATARQPMPLPGAKRSWPVVAAFRRLSANLPWDTPELRAPTLMVTSPTGGKGAAATAVGLAMALAEGGDSVALVDADLRHPQVGAYLGLARVRGLDDVLARRAPLDSALQAVQKGLPLLVVGSSAPGPDTDPAPLRRARMAALCAELEQRADVVIFVGAPVLTDADSVTLARVVGQAVVVVQTKTTRREEFRQAEEYLEATGATVVGTVLNGVKDRSKASADPAGAWSAPTTPRVPDEHDTSRPRPGGERADQVRQLRK